MFKINIDKDITDKFIIPELTSTLMTYLDDGLIRICISIEGGSKDFLSDPNARSTRMLNLFTNINSELSFQTFYLLLYNSYKMIERYNKEYNPSFSDIDNHLVNVDIMSYDFILKLLNYLDEHSYTIENVYEYLNSVYLTKYYSMKLKFFKDLKTQPKSGKNIIGVFENNDNLFLDNSFSLNYFDKTNSFIKLIPNIIFKNTSVGYKNYKYAIKHYIELTHDFLMEQKTIKPAELNEYAKKLFNAIFFNSANKTEIDVTSIPLEKEKCCFLSYGQYLDMDYLEDKKLNKDLLYILKCKSENKNNFKISKEAFYKMLIKFVNYIFDNFKVTKNNSIFKGPTFENNFNKSALDNFFKDYELKSIKDVIELNVFYKLINEKIFEYKENPVVEFGDFSDLNRLITQYYEYLVTNFHYKK